MVRSDEDPSASKGRRQFARLEVGFGAWLETLDGRQSVRLVNLSQGGAHLVLSEPDEAGEGMLTWLDFEMFGELAWQEGDRIGLTFDKPLTPRCLAETRRRAPSVVQDEAGGVSMTRAWVSGETGDT